MNQEKLKFDKKYYEEHKEQSKEYHKKYSEEHKEQRKEYSKKYREEHKEQCKEYDKEYQKKHRRHKDTCQICGEFKTMHYDHDHKTKLFRGWICNNCNVALGFARDSIPVLEKLISYLKNNEST